MKNLSEVRNSTEYRDATGEGKVGMVGDLIKERISDFSLRHGRELGSEFGKALLSRLNEDGAFEVGDEGLASLTGDVISSYGKAARDVVPAAIPGTLRLLDQNLGFAGDMVESEYGGKWDAVPDWMSESMGGALKWMGGQFGEMRESGWASGIPRQTEEAFTGRFTKPSTWAADPHQAALMLGENAPQFMTAILAHVVVRAAGTAAGLATAPVTGPGALVTAAAAGHAGAMATMSYMSAANAYQELIDNGWDENSAKTFNRAFGIGVVEGALEAIVPGMIGGKIAGKALKQLPSKRIKSLSGKFKKPTGAGLGTAASAIKYGFPEMATELTQEMWNLSMTLPPDEQLETWSEFWKLMDDESGRLMSGAAAGAGMGAGSGVAVSFVERARERAQDNKYGEVQDKLLDEYRARSAARKEYSDRWTAHANKRREDPAIKKITEEWSTDPVKANILNRARRGKPLTPQELAQVQRLSPDTRRELGLMGGWGQVDRDIAQAEAKENPVLPLLDSLSKEDAERVIRESGEEVFPGTGYEYEVYENQYDIPDVIWDEYAKSEKGKGRPAPNIRVEGFLLGNTVHIVAANTTESRIRGLWLHEVQHGATNFLLADPATKEETRASLISLFDEVVGSLGGEIESDDVVARHENLVKRAGKEGGFIHEMYLRNAEAMRLGLLEDGASEEDARMHFQLEIALELASKLSEKIDLGTITEGEKTLWQKILAFIERLWMGGSPADGLDDYSPAVREFLLSSLRALRDSVAEGTVKPSPGVSLSVSDAQGKRKRKPKSAVGQTVYRASSTGEFREGEPIWFADRPRKADFGAIVQEAKIQIENPFMFDELDVSEVVGIVGKGAEDILANGGIDLDKDMSAGEQLSYLLLEGNEIWQDDRIVSVIKSLGFDGVIAADPHGGELEYVVFSPSQVSIKRQTDARLSVTDARYDNGPLPEGVQSTARPTAVSRTHDFMERHLVVGMEAVDDVHKGKMAGFIRRNFPLPDKTGTDDELIQRAKEFVVSNLLYLHDLLPEEARELARVWYEGTNGMVNRWASKYRLEPLQVAAILATNSPNTDWFVNIARAERIMETLSNYKDLKTTPKMMRWLSDPARGADNKGKAKDGKLTMRERYNEAASALAGKTLGELLDEGRVEDAAHFVRAANETGEVGGRKGPGRTQGERFRTEDAPPATVEKFQLVHSYSPDGTKGEVILKKPTKEQQKAGLPGDPVKMAWAYDLFTIKSVEAYLSSDNITIDYAIGAQHKVRSFFNNIMFPNGGWGDTTIDIHAAGGGMFNAFSSKDPIPDSVTSSGGAGGSDITGLTGMYPLFADAFRAAAAQRTRADGDVLFAREMQSITWESVRAIISAEFKRAETGKRKAGKKIELDQIWEEFQNGNITQRQAQDRILNAAGGLKLPAHLDGAGVEEGTEPISRGPVGGTDRTGSDRGDGFRIGEPDFARGERDRARPDDRGDRRTGDEGIEQEDFSRGIGFLKGGRRVDPNISLSVRDAREAIQVNAATAFSGTGTLEAVLKNVANIFAVEYDPEIVNQFNRAFGTDYEPMDIVDLDPFEILMAAPDIFHASPVCKSFSSANRSVSGAKPLDRASAIAVAGVIRESTPPVITIENVPKYVKTKLFALIADALEENNYEWDVIKHNATDFGGRASRERIILRAARRDILPPGGKLPPVRDAVPGPGKGLGKFGKKAGRDIPEYLDGHLFTVVPTEDRSGSWFEAIKELIADAPILEPAKFKKSKREKQDVRNLVKKRGVMGQHGKLLDSIDPALPVITMGASYSSARDSSRYAHTLVSSESNNVKIILPSLSGLSKREREIFQPLMDEARTAQTPAEQRVVNKIRRRRAWHPGKVVRATPRMLARIMSLPDDFLVPGDTLEGEPEVELQLKHIRFAKKIIGNGLDGNTTRELIQPMVDLAAAHKGKEKAKTAEMAEKLPATMDPRTPSRRKGISMSVSDAGSDADYMKLAQNPKKNRNALRKLVDAAAKAAGHTLKGFHMGTEDVDIFSREIATTGFFFADNEEAARKFWDFMSREDSIDDYRTGPGVMHEAYLKVENPKEYENFWNDFMNSMGWKREETIRELELQGHDGIIIGDDRWLDLTEGRSAEGKQYVAFLPEQIKSAELITFYKKDDAAVLEGRAEAGDIIPLGERFKAEEKSIRLSVSDAEYRGQHTAPMRDSGAPGHDVTQDVYPDDIYGPDGARFYGHGDPYLDNQTMSTIKRMRGKENSSVTIYRAVPDEKNIEGIEHGDWVTINRNYAKLHGEHTLGGNYKVIQKKVKAGEIYTNGDSIHEWGYDPEVPEGDARLSVSDARFLSEELIVDPGDPRHSGAREQSVGPGGKVRMIDQANLAEIVKGKTLYHETNLSSARNVIARTERGRKRHHGIYASDNLDLALGQSGKGYVLEFDPNLSNGISPRTMANKTLSEIGELGGEYVVNKTVRGSLLSITVPTRRGIDAIRKIKGIENRFDFDNIVETERGLNITRKGDKPAGVSLSVSDADYRSKGRQLEASARGSTFKDLADMSRKGGEEREAKDPKDRLADPVNVPPNMPELEEWMDIADHLRQAYDLPGTVKASEILKHIAPQIEKDPDKWRKKLTRSFDPLSPEDILAFRYLMAKDAMDAWENMDLEKIKDYILLANRYRQIGTATARSMAFRRNNIMAPADKLKDLLAQGIFRTSEIHPTGTVGSPGWLDIELQKMEKTHEELKRNGISPSDILNYDINNNDDLIKLGIATRVIQTTKASWDDKFYEYWRGAGLLSAWTTQAANMVGNTGFSTWEFTAQKAADALFGVEGSRMNEILPAWGAMIKGTAQAFKLAFLTYKTELPVFDFRLGVKPMSEFHLSPAIAGKKGRIFRWSFRVLLAADQAARYMVFNMQTMARAVRIATDEKLKGADWEKRIKGILDDPFNEAIRTNLDQLSVGEEAIDKATMLTFQKEMGETAKTLSRFRDSKNFFLRWAARWHLPFLQTPLNIFKQSLRRSPFGILQLFSKTKRSQEGRRIMAEQFLSFGAMVTLMLLYDDEDEDGNKRMTGSRPFTFGEEERRRYRMDNAPPQSVRLGGKWVSYARLEPFATILTFIIDSLEVGEEAAAGKEASEVISSAAGRFVGQWRDKTFLQGVGDLSSMLSGEKDVTQHSARFLSSWMPNIIRKSFSSRDDLVRDWRNRDVNLNYFEKAGIRAYQGMFPDPSIAPPPKRDWLGRAMERDKVFTQPAGDWAFRMMSPVWTQEVDRPDDLAETVERGINIYNNKHPNTEFYPALIEFRKDKETVPEWHERMKLSGKRTLENLKYLGLDFDNLTEEDIGLIRKTITQSRSEVTRQLSGSTTQTRGRSRRGTRGGRSRSRSR